MGSIWSKFREQDPDELFAYSTAKIVRIRDRRLGLLRLAFQVAILIYVIGFVIMKDKQYLEYEEPIGTVQTSLRKPSGLIDPSSYPFCRQYNGPPAASVGLVDSATCTVWDEDQVRQPISLSASMFVTTRVSASLQARACAEGAACSIPYETITKNKYFLPGVENYTIGILHTFQARRFLEESSTKTSMGTIVPGSGNTLYAGTSKELTGTLVNKNGEVIQTFSDANGINIIELWDLLSAADTDLGIKSDAIVPGNADESIRNAGTILTVEIKYEIVSSKKQFVITVQRIPGAEYKVVTTEPVNATHRLSFNRHGVQIMFIQTGSISRFVFQFFLVQLFTAFGMLAVAGVLVDAIMLFFLPERLHYSTAKYDVTEDFSDVRDSKRLGNDPVGALNPVSI